MPKTSIDEAKMALTSTDKGKRGRIVPRKGFSTAG